MVVDNPILNSPYEEPRRHYATDDSGALDYARIAEGTMPIWSWCVKR